VTIGLIPRNLRELADLEQRICFFSKDSLTNGHKCPKWSGADRVVEETMTCHHLKL
jgi:hypothetical protein